MTFRTKFTKWFNKKSVQTFFMCNNILVAMIIFGVWAYVGFNVTGWIDAGIIAIGGVALWDAQRVYSEFHT
jgi:hypothetical protein